MTNSIGILGCGWLGLPLAGHFIAEGFSVKGSTTSASKLGLLENVGIEPFLLDISQDNAGWTNFLKTDVLIIAIPPKRDFAARLSRLLPMTDIPVVLISATSVYGNAEGLIDEATQAAPETENAREMVLAENLIRDRGNAAILRLGGLVGKDRHPVHHLSGRENLPDPDAPVNLIHQTDAIRLISRIIEMEKWETFNGVYPEYPTRENYYRSEAAKRGLSLPKFQPNGKKGKTVSSEKAIRELDFTFTEKP
jgi:nucleoside-diphosphate-sugar epimerase